MKDAGNFKSFNPGDDRVTDNFVTIQTLVYMREDGRKRHGYKLGKDFFLPNNNLVEVVFQICGDEGCGIAIFSF